jgi:hypothetical protein
MGYQDMLYRGQIEAVRKVMGVGIGGKVEKNLPVKQGLAPGPNFPAPPPGGFPADPAGTKGGRDSLRSAGSHVL